MRRPLDPAVTERVVYAWLLPLIAILWLGAIAAQWSPVPPPPPPRECRR
jgi:hypothetical protein